MVSTEYPVKNQIQQQYNKREIEIAQAIQRALLPKSNPKFKNLSVAGFTKSAKPVGGDIFDMYPLAEDKLFILIADVMGTGIPAAIFAAILKSTVRALSPLATEPGKLLERVNEILFQDLVKVEMFITAQAIMIDPIRNQFCLANAGHCPFLVYDEQERTAAHFSPEGLPLGIVGNATYQEHHGTFPQKFLSLLYTDGVTECQNPAGAQFEQQGLVRWLRATNVLAMDGPGVARKLESDLLAYQGSTGAHDDQTLVVIKSI